MSKLTFKIVTTENPDYQKSLQLRQEVLREPLGMNLVDEDLSKEKDAYHVLAFFENKVVGTLYLLPKNLHTFQMKQVAVDVSKQGQGIGKKLIRYAESFSMKKGIKIIQLDARENAWLFYEHCGYAYKSEAFDQIGITHKVMEKAL